MASVFFEDLELGHEFATSMSDPITSAMVDDYFRLTGDRFNIHRDDEFARAFGLRAAMVPGNLVVAIATGLVYQAGYFTDSLVVQARKDTRFRQPLYVGERIHVTEKVITLEDRPSKRYGRVLLHRIVLNELHETIQRVEQDYRIVKRASMAAIGRSEGFAPVSSAS